MNDHFKAYEGGQTIQLPVDLSSIPMFLRGAAVYMTIEDIHHIAKDTMKTLDLFVSCEQDVEFTYYDDDGWSNEYEAGVFDRTKIYRQSR